MVEIGLTDMSKSGKAMAHPAHPGTTGLQSHIIVSKINQGSCLGCLGGDDAPAELNDRNHGQGTHSAKMGADISAKIPQTPQNVSAKFV